MLHVSTPANFLLPQHASWEIVLEAAKRLEIARLLQNGIRLVRSLGGSVFLCGFGKL